jgi:phosphoglucomutase
VEGFGHSVTVNVIDSTETYVAMMRELFDFDFLKTFVNRPDFGMLFDGMHGASGPYAKKIFGEIFGV